MPSAADRGRCVAWRVESAGKGDCCRTPGHVATCRTGRRGLGVRCPRLTSVAPLRHGRARRSGEGLHAVVEDTPMNRIRFAGCGADVSELSAATVRGRTLALRRCRKSPREWRPARHPCVGMAHATRIGEGDQPRPDQNRHDLKERHPRFAPRVRRLRAVALSVSTTLCRGCSRAMSCPHGQGRRRLACVSPSGTILRRIEAKDVFDVSGCAPASSACFAHVARVQASPRAARDLSTHTPR